MDTTARKRNLPVRQKLACTFCRGRKVKCDRVKPCSACCARGNPSACRFVVVDGSDYKPIQQSLAIRGLRREIKELQGQLRDACERHLPSRTDDDLNISDEGIRSRATGPKRRPLVTGQASASLSGAGTVAESMTMPFARLSLMHHGSKDLALVTAYPFPSLKVGDNTTAALTRLLPGEQEIFRNLDIFYDMAQSFAVPQTPDKMRKKEVKRFLSNVEHNATETPDMLALLFAALALVLHMGLAGKRHHYSSDEIKASFTRGDCYIAASMQALRNASFMNEPTLTGIKTLLIIGVNLSKTGRIQDAWALFGTTVRLAYSIELHRDPDTLSPPPLQNEKAARQRVWWLMLYSDQCLSSVLCKPLGISSIGNCPRPILFTSDSLELRAASTVHEFTLVAREILGYGGAITSREISVFTKKLETLWNAMPEALHFNASWLQTEKSRPESPLDVMSARLYADIQFLIIFLNSRQLAIPPCFEKSSPMPGDKEVPRYPTRISSPLQPGLVSSSPSAIDGCIHLLRALLFLWRYRTILLVSHPLESQAMTAVMILLADAWETGSKANLGLVEIVTTMFVEMRHNGGSRAADLAIGHISHARTQLNKRR